MFEQAAEALGFLAARFELVGADRAGARAFAAQAGALAVELALELGLPETELGLELGILRRELGGLFFDHRQALAERRSALVDGGLQLGLLLCGEAGNGGLGVLVFLKDESRLEGLVPLGPLLGERGFQHRDLAADLLLLHRESRASDLDFRRAVFFDHRGYRVAK